MQSYIIQCSGFELANKKLWKVKTNITWKLESY